MLSKLRESQLYLINQIDGKMELSINSVLLVVALIIAICFWFKSVCDLIKSKIIVLFTVTKAMFIDRIED